MGTCMSSVKEKRNKLLGKTDDKTESKDAAARANNEQSTSPPATPATADRNAADTLSVPAPATEDELSHHPTDLRLSSGHRSEHSSTAQEQRAADAQLKLPFEDTTQAKTSVPDHAAGVTDKDSSTDDVSIPADGETRGDHTPGSTSSPSSQASSEGDDEIQDGRDGWEGSPDAEGKGEATSPIRREENGLPSPNAYGPVSPGPTVADQTASLLVAHGPSAAFDMGMPVGPELPPFEWVTVPPKSNWERAVRTGEAVDTSDLKTSAFMDPQSSAYGAGEGNAPPPWESRPSKQDVPLDSFSRTAAGTTEPRYTDPADAMVQPNTFYCRLPVPMAPAAALPSTRNGNADEDAGSYSYSYSYWDVEYSGTSGSYTDYSGTYSSVSAGSSYTAATPRAQEPSTHSVQPAGAGQSAWIHESNSLIKGTDTPVQDNTPVTYLFQTLRERPVAQRSVFQLDEMWYR